VRVVQEPAAIVLEVLDNGIGMSPEQATAPTSLGLLGMRERAHLWGGDVTFEGQPGVGTTVRVRLPLETPQTPPTP
jgi:signal transduction histidine kinase